MRLKLFLALGLVPMAMTCMGVKSARAQDSSQPPRPLTLEYAGPAPGTPAAPGTVATAPGSRAARPDDRTAPRRDGLGDGSRAAIAQLTNPYDGGTMPVSNSLSADAHASSAPAPMGSAQSPGPPLVGGR